jgi:cytochrome c biogenesis protein
VWAWLHSTELTLWLLGLLVLAMALGTIIPQGAPERAYARFGAILGPLIYRSSLTHVFTAWWFTLLFALLVANLTACVVRRLQVQARLGRASQPVSSAQIRGRRSTASWTLQQAPAAAVETVAQALRGRGYRVVPATAASKDESALRARRGGVRSWGPIIVHAGMVVVLVGAAYGRLPGVGFDRSARITAGSTYDVQMGARSFGIRLLDAGTERTATGAPSQYWARTEVVVGGNVIRTVTITPNHPLRYNGTNIVLNSLFEAPSYAVEVRKGDSVSYIPITMDANGQVDWMGSVVRLEDPPWLVWVRDFRVAHAGMPGGESEPEALVRLDESGTVSANRRDLGWVGPGGVEYKGVHFELVSAHASTEVQLGVHRDPGVPVVWSGFGLVLLGCLLAVFVTRREIVATVAPRSGGKAAVLVGASAYGLGPGADRMLESLGADLGAQQEVDAK